MAKLNKQQNTMHGGGVPLADDISSQGTDRFAGTPPAAGSTATSDSNDTAAMENMKRQLELATERMARWNLSSLKLVPASPLSRQSSLNLTITAPPSSRSTPHSLPLLRGSPSPLFRRAPTMTATRGALARLI